MRRAAVFGVAAAVVLLAGCRHDGRTLDPPVFAPPTPSTTEPPSTEPPTLPPAEWTPIEDPDGTLAPLTP